ncbi:uncharacterized protein LTR77_006847 [Saxophila tyrrhenica]|uniref:Beta-lactamase-related domain-containing protein n=1 Tax=Saxophila tyrrhenica TaxID=1690608 RepID=A0AAV9P9R9_9PEZI|nr:hypothetical protein LTR77_006847 [Saxophila tyrrhenica]
MLFSSFLLSLALSSIATAKPCPILGPVFEAPTGLADSPVLKEAFEVLQAVLDNATETGQTPAGPWFGYKNNSIALTVFDTSDSEFFSYQYSSSVLQKASQGVTKITEDAIFRIGSLSKLVSAYAWLIEAGPTYWDQPITKYIPELKKAAKKCSAADGPIDCTDWDEITLGALASHQAGIPRDYSTPAELLDPFSSVGGGEGAVALGLPPLPESALPPCGLGPTDACSIEQWLAGIIAADPIYAPFSTPVYSNGGYIILAAAFERITGKSTSDMVDGLFERLNMTQSSYSNPEGLDNAVIPLGVNSGYQAILGIESPVGGYFSTQSDIAKLGRSILKSSELSPAVTRQWMKPSIFTESTTAAVGMPWEIFRVPGLLNDHDFDLYTKTGDVLDYSSHLILSKEYNVGFGMLVAGNDTTTTRSLLAEVITPILFPALEKIARAQAHEKYAGTYKSTGDVDFEVELTTDAGKPGLRVVKFASNGTETFPGLDPETTVLHLYPTNLIHATSESEYKIAYRAVSDKKGNDPSLGLFSTGCENWFLVGATRYGGIDLDQIVFTVEDGKATTMAPRAWRRNLQKAD